jgi:pilus assembly protein CpaF
MTASGMNVSAGASIPDYKKLRDFLITSVTQDHSVDDLSPEKRRSAVEDRLKEAITRTKLTFSDSIRASLIRDILDEVTGYGPIQPLLDDPDITEIMVNGPQKVYIKKNWSFRADECSL